MVHCAVFSEHLAASSAPVQGLARLKVWVRRMSRQIRNVHANDVAKLLVECFLHLLARRVDMQPAHCHMNCWYRLI